MSDAWIMSGSLGDGKTGGDPKKDTMSWRLENDTKVSGIWDRGDCETVRLAWCCFSFLRELRERG